LKTNDSLEELFINGNAIGDDGARAVAEMLAENVGLRALHLARNSIGVDGEQALKKGMLKNKTLRTMDMMIHLFNKQQLGVYRW
jgi:Ran GTPase-activating protein (RanGAP) involved in mRNA processing and transport